MTDLLGFHPPLVRQGVFKGVDLKPLVLIEAGLERDSPDNRILSIAYKLHKEGKSVTFVSKDVNVRIKADALGIHAEDYEYIWTSLGFFKALVLVPSMDKTPPIGMFRKGGTVRVLIETDDDRHLPVRFSVGFLVGTGTATLMDYTPPK